jgi:hypothetical protein
MVTPSLRLAGQPAFIQRYGQEVDSARMCTYRVVGINAASIISFYSMQSTTSKIFGVKSFEKLKRAVS